MRLLMSRRLSLMRRYQGGISFGPEPTAAELAAAFGRSLDGAGKLQRPLPTVQRRRPLPCPRGRRPGRGGLSGLHRRPRKTGAERPVSFGTA